MYTYRLSFQRPVEHVSHLFCCSITKIIPKKHMLRLMFATDRNRTEAAATHAWLPFCSVVLEVCVIDSRHYHTREQR